ncbi:MAG: DUF2079 domain-containing protein [Bacteroidia bacterium]|nr:DUF2079 domain-containing protein [Bacteroidia bacterium]
MKQYMIKRLLTNHKFYIYCSLIIFGIIFFTTAIINHYYFRTFAFDYGTYNFVFWDYSHFRVSVCPIYPDKTMTFLQDHFSFTLMYFIPIYWLLNWLTGTYTLLIIQTTLILLSGWIVYRLIVLKTGEAWLGLAALLYYFLLQGRYSTFTGDVNIAVISACMVPFFIYFFETKRYFATSIIFVLALFSRENMPVWFIFILFILMIWHRKEKRVLFICSIYIVSSIIFFVVLFKFFIPLFETPEKTYNLFNYSALGANPSSAIIFILKHPVEVFRMFFENHLGQQEYNGVKLEFYRVYLVSGGFVLFYRPQYFIWFIPIVAQKMLNDFPIRWGIEWYYSIEVVTILPLTVFIILSEIKSSKLKYVLAAAVCILALKVTINKTNPENRKMAWWGTVKENIFDKNFFKSEFDVKKAHDYLKLIPADAKVSATERIIPQLSQRQYIYNFPKVSDAEYIVAMSAGNHYYPLNNEEFSNEISKYRSNPDWNILVNENSLLILKKKHLCFYNRSTLL